MKYLSCTPSPQSTSTAILDSGCTGHFLIANAHCKEKQLAESPFEVHLPNRTVIASTHTATLDIASLTTAAIKLMYYLVWPNTCFYQWGKCMIVDVQLLSRQTRSLSNMDWPKSWMELMIWSPVFGELPFVSRPLVLGVKRGTARRRNLGL
jgi:hypothetical protein